MGEGLSRRSGVIPALVRCAHGPLGPRPRAVWAASSRLLTRPLSRLCLPGRRSLSVGHVPRSCDGRPNAHERQHKNDRERKCAVARSHGDSRQPGRPNGEHQEQARCRCGDPRGQVTDVLDATSARGAGQDAAMDPRDPGKSRRQPGSRNKPRNRARVEVVARCPEVAQGGAASTTPERQDQDRHVVGAVISLIAVAIVNWSAHSEPEEYGPPALLSDPAVRPTRTERSGQEQQSNDQPPVAAEVGSPIEANPGTARQP